MKRAAGIYLISENTQKLLVLLRSSISPDGNTWSVVSGMVDEGESFSRAALREFKEELNANINLDLIPFYQDVCKNMVYKSFIAFIPKEIVFDIDLYENSAFKWINKKELDDLSPKHWGFNRCLEDESSKIILDSFLAEV
jgi:ADP-ribose pyrophosphatase YjhB (NUDIX family)